MLFELKEITIGTGNPDWGAPPYEVFIIKLGKREDFNDMLIEMGDSEQLNPEDFYDDI